MLELQLYRQVAALSKRVDPSMFPDLVRTLVGVTESMFGGIELVGLGSWSAFSEVESKFDPGQVLVVPIDAIGTITLRGRAVPYGTTEREMTDVVARQLVLLAPSLPRTLPLVDAMRYYRRRHISELLRRLDWNVARVARELGIARSHLYDLMAELELRRGA